MEQEQLQNPLKSNVKKTRWDFCAQIIVWGIAKNPHLFRPGIEREKNLVLWLFVANFLYILKTI